MRQIDRFGLGEHMRVAPHQLLANALRNACKIEATELLGHARVEHHLKQQISEFVAQPLQIAARYRIGHLVRFLNREWRNAREVLLAIPGTAGLRIAQRAHQRQQCIDLLPRAAQVRSSPSTSRRLARMPAVAPQILRSP